MTNKVVYKFEWVDTDASELIHKTLGDLVYGSGYAIENMIRSQDMHSSMVTFYVKAPNDVARIASFDAALNVAVSTYDKYGFTWVDNTRDLRQPRVMRASATQVYVATDSILNSTRQRNKSVSMQYINPAAKIDCTIDVTDWVVVGEICYVGKVSSLLRDFFRRSDVTVVDFITAYPDVINSDQAMIYGMNKAGLTVPITTPETMCELNMEQVNDWLRARNFLIFGEIAIN